MGQEYVTVAGFAQGLGGNRPNLAALETSQAFAKARQAIPAGLHCLRGQITVVIQPAALANCFFQVFGSDEFLVFDNADFEAEAVGAEVYRGESLF